MSKNVKVSVLCAAYNHEKYLRQCLDGLVMQKTTFPFEVLVNDDASTDGTAEIIREYAEKYPDIIIPFYQEKNLYSQNISIYQEVFLPHIRGEYVAICEGDDYWIDPEKLQRQVDIMEQHPDCKISFCRVEIVDVNGCPTGTFLPECSVKEGVFSPEEFLKLISKTNFQTSGRIVKTDLYKECCLNPPEFVRISPVGDVATMLYFSLFGNIYFQSCTMSNYRTGVAGSWTQRTANKMYQHYRDMLEVFASYDDYTAGRFRDVCQLHKNRYHFLIAYHQGNYTEIANPQYRQYVALLPRTEKIRLYLGRYCPALLPVVTRAFHFFKRIIHH